MFSDFTSDAIGFDSTKEKEIDVSVAATQTSPSQSKESQSQTSLFSDAEVQSDIKNITTAPVLYDEGKLAAFLKRICPRVLEELSHDEFIKDEAYKEELYEPATKLGKITRPTQDLVVKVSSLSWNSTGMTLAIGYGTTDHVWGWCKCDGIFELYNASQLNHIQLVKTVATSSCISTLCYHPTLPSVLAVGLCSGDVRVWDHRIEDEPVVGNPEGCAHQSTATVVTWIENVSLGETLLVSAGLDGCIKFWKISYANHTMQPLHRLFIPMDHSPMSRVSNDEFGLEIRCLSFWSESDEFVCAVDGGGVLHCSTRGARPLTLTSLPHDHADPVSMAYLPHQGVSTWVDCSQTSDLFAACSTAQVIHVFRRRQVEPIHVVHTHCVYGVAWTIDDVMACWGGNPSVELYMTRSAASKIQELGMKQDGIDEITAVTFNRQRRGVVAVGCGTGLVQVWRLPEVAPSY